MRVLTGTKIIGKAQTQNADLHLFKKKIEKKIDAPLLPYQKIEGRMRFAVITLVKLTKLFSNGHLGGGVPNYLI